MELPADEAEAVLMLAALQMLDMMVFENIHYMCNAWDKDINRRFNKQMSNLSILFVLNNSLTLYCIYYIGIIKGFVNIHINI